LALVALLVQPVLRPTTEEPAVGSQVPGYESRTEDSSSYASPPAQWPPPPPKPAEPPAWASAAAPGGAVIAEARDHEVVLRRPDGTMAPLGPGKPLALAFAPDGQRLATAGPGPLVRTWDFQGNALAESRVAAAARGLAYTPDGRWLLVLDAAGGITVLDPATLAPGARWCVDGPANSIACAPDGQTVAVAFGSWLDAEAGWVDFWSIPLRRRLVTYRAAAPVGATRFGPDGRTLVIGGWNGSLTWRTLPGGELLAERQLPKGLVAAAAFSPDAGTLPLEPPPEPTPPSAPLAPRLPDLLQAIGQLPHR
jgi:hypothetical protein